MLSIGTQQRLSNVSVHALTGGDVDTWEDFSIVWRPIALVYSFMSDEGGVDADTHGYPIRNRDVYVINLIEE